MDGRYAAYGSVPGTINGELTQAKRKLASNRPGVAALLGILFVPWLIFVIVYWIRSFDIHYQSSVLCDVLCYALLVIVAAFAGMTANLARSGDPVPMALLTVTTLIGWIAGFALGNHGYHAFMKPYYDISNLNHYPHVNPRNYQGNQLMDAGMIEFSPGAKLWLPKSIGFKNENVYCAAPIVMNDPKTNKAIPMDNYDFWAVGINCCSGHAPDFRCGEYSNPFSRWGLRIMDDDAREMFRLAVKEAEATYNLKATHPIFVHWLSDPGAEVDAYQDDGFSFFAAAVGIGFGVQAAIVTCITAVLSYV